MKIIEKNEGKKINYNLTGTKLDFADGALTLDLARYQQDDPVTRDIMVDSEGYLTTGRGLYYAAQVEIPARKYTETVTPAEETDAQAEGGENTEGMSRETVTRTPEPLDTDDVTLYLFAIDGIYRELKRGAYDRLDGGTWEVKTAYSPDIAEEKYQAHLREKGPDLKIGNDHELANYIETTILDKDCSPAAVLGFAMIEGKKFKTSLSKRSVNGIKRDTPGKLVFGLMICI